MAIKITKNKGNLLGLLILSTVVILASIFLPKFLNKDSEKSTIKSIVLSEKCEALITFKSGKSESINVDSNVVSKVCKVSPVVSKDGKYAAFDLNLVVKDTSSKSGKSTNNSSIVYIADLGKWANVYNHGAGEATSISFNENNDLVVNVQYEGENLKPWVIKNSDLVKMINNEDKSTSEPVK